MGENIAAYGLIGDTGSAALVSLKGTLAWLCWPDFDSEACFASLIGTEENGYWSLGPKSVRASTRRYLPGTMVLETTHTQLFGATVTVTDFMPKRDGYSCVIRIVRGVKGRTHMSTCIAPRFDYGTAQPRIEQKDEDCWNAVAGPHRLVLRSNVPLQQQSGDLTADWVVKAGETYFFVLQHSTSYKDAETPPRDALKAEREATNYWSRWISQSTYKGHYKEVVDGLCSR